MRACCLCTRPQLLLAYPSPLVQPREKRDDNLWYQIYPLKEKKYTMDHVISTFFVLLNPLTPDSTVTGHNDRWALFHFWHHHLWPKLASLILKVRRRKSPFLMVPRLEWLGQSSLKYARNAQKLEKLGPNFSFLNHFLGNSSTTVARGRSFLISARAQEKGHKMMLAGGKKGMPHVVNASLSIRSLELSWPITRLKMSKAACLPKSSVC